MNKGEEEELSEAVIGEVPTSSAEEPKEASVEERRKDDDASSLPVGSDDAPVQATTTVSNAEEEPSLPATPATTNNDSPTKEALVQEDEERNEMAVENDAAPKPPTSNKEEQPSLPTTKSTPTEKEEQKIEEPPLEEKKKKKTSILLCLDESLPPWEQGKDFCQSKNNRAAVEEHLYRHRRHDVWFAKSDYRQPEDVVQVLDDDTNDTVAEKDPPTEECEPQPQEKFDFSTLLCTEELPAVSTDSSMLLLPDEKILDDLQWRDEWEAAWKVKFATLKFPKGKKRKRRTSKSASSNKAENQMSKLEQQKAKRNNLLRQALSKEEDEFLDKYAPMLRYSWKALKLTDEHTNLGTRAYNNALQKQQQALQPDCPPPATVVPSQIHQLFHSLKPTTIPLPQDLSFLRSAKQTPYKDNNDDDLHDEHGLDTFETVGQVFENLCRQDIHHWKGSYAKAATNHWSSEAIHQEITSLQQQCNDLETRERDVLQEATACGIVSKESWAEAYKFLGIVRPPMTEPTTSKKKRKARTKTGEANNKTKKKKEKDGSANTDKKKKKKIKEVKAKD